MVIQSQCSSPGEEAISKEKYHIKIQVNNSAQPLFGRRGQTRHQWKVPSHPILSAGVKQFKANRYETEVIENTVTSGMNDTKTSYDQQVENKKYIKTNPEESSFVSCLSSAHLASMSQGPVMLNEPLYDMQGGQQSVKVLVIVDPYQTVSLNRTAIANPSFGGSDSIRSNEELKSTFKFNSVITFKPRLD